MKDMVVSIADKNGTLVTFVSVGKAAIDGTFDGESGAMLFTANEWVLTSIDGKIINEIIGNESTE